MENVEAELRGRLVMLETLLAVAIAKLAGAGNAKDAAGTIAAIMANAEAMLEQACAAADPDERQAAEYARAAFDQVGDAMQRHVLKITPRGGLAS